MLLRPNPDQLSHKRLISSLTGWTLSHALPLVRPIPASPDSMKQDRTWVPLKNYHASRATQMGRRFAILPFRGFLLRRPQHLRRTNPRPDDEVERREYRVSLCQLHLQTKEIANEQ